MKTSKQPSRLIRTAPDKVDKPIPCNQLRRHGWRCTSILAAGALLASPAFSSQRFDAPVDVAVSSGFLSTSPAILDANGDGLTDLVRPNGFLPRLQGGEFQLFERLDLALGATSGNPPFGPGDVDGDGDLDLFTYRADGADRRLLVFENVAGVGLSVSPLEVHPIPASFTNFLSSSALELRDLDGDGVTDVYVTGFRTDWIALRRGSGYEFQVIESSSGVSNTELEDVTGDGLADLFEVTDYSTRFRQQVAPGVFGPPTLFTQAALGAEPRQILFDDLDGDGDQDLIVLTQSSIVATFTNTDGAGTFVFESSIFSSDGTSEDVIETLQLFDADNDGDLDLVSTPAPRNNARRPLRWLERDGSFLPPAVIATVREPKDVRYLTLTDVSGDGLADVLVGTSDGLFVVVSEDQPAGTLFLGGRYQSIGGPSNSASSADSIVPFDFDGDGDLDVAFAGPQGETLWISINNGAGRFGPAFRLENQGPEVNLFTAGDVDGDGDDDLVVQRRVGIAWLDNQGGGEFVERVIEPNFQTQFPAPILVDLDQDGDLDVLTHRTSTSVIVLVEQEPTGTFLPPRDLVVSGGRFNSAAFLDMDHDGDLDVALGQEPQGGRILLYEQTAPLTLGPPRILTAGGVNLGSLTTIDVTGDGVKELVWLATNGTQVRASEVRPQGDLGAPFTAATTSASGTIVDLPSRSTDGRDLVVGTELGELLYLRFTGSQGYEPPVVIVDGIRPPRLLNAADIDLDGDVDLVVGPNPIWLPSRFVRSFGDGSCDTAVPNSTGRVAQLTLSGNEFVAADNVTLIGSDLPGNSLVLFLCSLTPGEVLTAGGSPGTLCLGGEIGRYVAPGQAGLTNADGRRDLELNLASFPQPMGSVPVLAGQRWHFQGWHRDSVDGAATSNFTASTSALFR